MDDVRKLVEAVTSRPGYTSAVGTEVLHAEKGKVSLRVKKRPDLLQFSGFFHGGVIAGLADHAAGGAATTLMPPGRIAITVEFKINFLSPANGDAIVARAETIQSSGTISVVKVDVFSEAAGKETPCAFCIATMRAVDMATAKMP